MQPILVEEVHKLEKKVKSANLPVGLLDKIQPMIERVLAIASSGAYSQEFESLNRYTDWVVSLPWNEKTEDILDLNHARQVLDRSHYGLLEIKERILEYLAVLTLRSQEQSISRAPILCFIGLVGTGKTTLAYSISQALGRKFARIPFGGLGDPLQLRGQSRVYPDSEPGQIIKALRLAKAKNPVILLDEIDRVVEHNRADVMGVLVELLDPEQNKAFTDHFIDYPFDLSEVLFIATANNTTNIATAVLDRLEPIQMPSYTDEEKIVIGRDYILPKAIRESGLPPGAVTVANDVWPKIVRPLGFDAGMRSLERTIQAICRKAAKLKVEGKGEHFEITAGNLKEFIAAW